MAPVQPSASVVATGLGIRYISNWAYAYSGVNDSVNDNETTLLLFSSGSGVLNSKFQFNSRNEEAQECNYRIYFNNVVVQHYLAGNNAPDYRGKPDGIMRLIIPPFTEVKCTAQNNDDSVTLAGQLVSMIARVYGAE